MFALLREVYHYCDNNIVHMIQSVGFDAWFFIFKDRFLKSFLDKPEPPKIDWDVDPEPIPEYFKEDHPWDVTILEAPPCPKTSKIIRLVKSSPFDFDLRVGSKIISRILMFLTNELCHMIYRDSYRMESKLFCFMIRCRYYLRSHLRNQKAEGQDMFFLIGQGDSADKKGFMSSNPTVWSLVRNSYYMIQLSYSCKYTKIAQGTTNKASTETKDAKDNLEQLFLEKWNLTQKII